VIATNVGSVNDLQLDSGHFDARFVVRPYAVTPDDVSITLPVGRGLISLRGERSDETIVRGLWVARRCKVVPRPPIYCGGIAGIACPEGMTCVDWPGDDCDPNLGHADCMGMCVDKQVPPLAS
jgi:hypothetical protein